MKTFFAWHFTADKLRDGSPLPKVGKWEHYEGKLEMCKSGLHWSRDPFDALQDAPGANLRRVEIKGDFLEQDDKGCSHYRRAVYQTDATELLRYFARMQALSIIHLYPNGADNVVFDYLMTGDESIRKAAGSVARAAANYAEWSSKWAVALAAARVSAGSAAREAAWAAAARDAEWEAAFAAARAATRASAYPATAARKMFNKLVRENK
jgi:hypothetical protein